MKSVSRSTFLKTAGVAAGAAAVSTSPAGASLRVEPEGVETTASMPIPDQPIVAIVRDAELGEVTVLAGTSETTYVDRALARRLVKASRRNGRGVGEEA